MYEKTNKYHHHERPAKKDMITGKFKVIGGSSNNIPDDKILFIPHAKFAKTYKSTWKFLDLVLTPTEYRIVHKMSMIAERCTNSLKPLNDETSIRKLAEHFNISKNLVKKVFAKLKGIGVYAEISYEEDFEERCFWILNPYISFNAELIPKLYLDVFDNTTIGKQFKNK